MNKDQLQGRTEKAKGKLKEIAGKAVGNDRMRTEGQMQQATGGMQGQMGDAKEKLKKGIDKL